jgi:hypothetical protein
MPRQLFELRDRLHEFNLETIETWSRTDLDALSFNDDWGVQHALADGDPGTAQAAVARVVRALYDPTGGVIAQAQFGPGGHPENVRAVFEAWEHLAGKPDGRPDNPRISAGSIPRRVLS